MISSGLSIVNTNPSHLLATMAMDKILFNMKFTARNLEKEASKMERLQKTAEQKALACQNDEVGILSSYDRVQ